MLIGAFIALSILKVIYSNVRRGDGATDSYSTDAFFVIRMNLALRELTLVAIVDDPVVHDLDSRITNSRVLRSCLQESGFQLE